MMFLSPDEAVRKQSEETFERIASEHDLNVIGWRDVPTNNWNLGESAKSAEPFIRQVFVAKTDRIADDAMFERKLYVTRRWTKELLTCEDARFDREFYVASLSAKTIIYKGMLTTHQLASYYLDLNDLAFETGLAVVHSRFSTNTFPSWNRAQPLRYIAHNGEFNTLRGNVNWMYAREQRLKSELFGNDFPKTLSILDAYVSDSGAFDNALEMLHLAGRELPHGVMMMIPEPLSELNPMSDAKRAFYEFHSALMEPWDRPASITFTNGEIIGAVLDRNGLRPSR